MGKRRLRATTGWLASLSFKASDNESAFRTGRALSLSGWTVDIACLYTSCSPVAELSNTVCWSNNSTHPKRRMPLTRKTETQVAAVRAALRKASCPCRGSSVICGVRMKDVFFVAYVVKEGSVSELSHDAFASQKDENDCTQVWSREFPQLTRTYARPT